MMNSTTMDGAMPATTVSSPTSLAVYLTGAAMLAGIFHLLCKHTPDPREPPVVASRIPYVGHLIGMLRHGKSYYQMLDQTAGLDIYTLPILRWSFYVITSPSMAAAANRAPKNLSFRPIQVSLSKTLGGLSDDIHHINEKNLMDEEGEGVMSAIHHIMYSMLPTGPELDALTQRVLDQVADNFHALPKTEFNIDLFDFSKQIMGRSTIRALYGAGTPLDDPTMVADYWDFDDSMLALLASPLPRYTQPRGYNARERLRERMMAYFEGGFDEKASAMMRARFAAYRKHGYTNDGLARTEVIMIVGAVSNSTITAFNFLARILSSASLHAELVSEVRAAAVTTRDSNTNTLTTNVPALRDTNTCPLLNSVFRETLRLTSTTTGSKQILADTILADRYLLKKGSYLSVEGAVLHYKSAVWGDDAAAFNARRFVASQNGVGPGGKKIPPAAWRAFGGGDVLCPGRNLAANEILGLAVPVLLGLEVMSKEGGWVVPPEPYFDDIPVGVLRPKGSVGVRVARREGWEDVEWVYRV